MTLDEKTKMVEEARLLYPTFDAEFKEFLAVGNSPNGAYNYFTAELIEKHKLLSVREKEKDAWNTKHGSLVPASPVKLSEYSVLDKLEKLYESISNT